MATGTDTPELERLRKDLDHEHQMYLRALADFDNYRRRADQDRAAATQREKRNLLLSVIDLLDNFDRAVEHMEEDSPVADGVRAIHRQLQSLVEAQGAIPFSSLGEAFDPALHEAIGSDAIDGEHEAGTVTQELRRGYRWGDHLLRPARVRVAQ